MNNLKKKFLSLVDDGVMQARSMFESFNDVINSIDWDAHLEKLNERKDALLTRGNDLLNDLNELFKQVKESVTDFIVSVPFDEASGEKISYEVKDGKLVVEVTYSDDTTERSNKTSITIPSDCDCDKLTFETDGNAKTATITIPKVVPMKEETTNEVEDNGGANEEVNEHISQRLSERIARNIDKRTMHRAPNGRFVRREITVE